MKPAAPVTRTATLLLFHNRPELSMAFYRHSTAILRVSVGENRRADCAPRGAVAPGLRAPATIERRPAREGSPEKPEVRAGISKCKGGSKSRVPHRAGVDAPLMPERVAAN